MWKRSRSLNPQGDRSGILSHKFDLMALKRCRAKTTPDAQGKATRWLGSLAIFPQHFSATGTDEPSILLEASQDGEIAVSDELSAQPGNIAGAALLLGRVAAPGKAFRGSTGAKHSRSQGNK